VHDRPRAVAAFLHRAWIFSRTLFIVIVALGGLLVAARVALPSVLRSQINGRLNRVPGYAGHVDEIHVALWRGAYALRGVRIVKRRGSETDPFVSARNIDFSLAWRELIHGRIVSDIVVDDGRVNFVKAATREASQLEVDRTWQDVVKDIFPIDITHLMINDGRIHYIDRTANPVVDVFVEHLQFLATGLQNRSSEKEGKFPAHIKLTGDSIGEGKLSAWADVEPLATQMHFEVHGQIENVSLPALNPFLKAYGGVEVDAGNFKLYAEMAARDGRFEGYVKPFFIHVKFTDLTQSGRSVPERMWQAAASVMVTFLKNKSQDELATRIPFSGEFGHTEVGTWKTITSMLHNGFIHALPDALEHSVNSDALKPATVAPASRPPG
jgi:hypothetical protein